jgi:hypothetical protein
MINTNTSFSDKKIAQRFHYIMAKGVKENIVMIQGNWNGDILLLAKD